jgi:glycosyltransferase involved in cell wall biosynthesis
MKIADISVIIPVFNSERYLAEAIESVLGQTMGVREILVIDDGSTDASGEVVGRFPEPVRYYRQEHGGAVRARNHGVRLSQGAMVAFLDADDVWMPQKIELQLGAFSRQPQLDFVLGGVEQFISPELCGGGQPRLRQELATMPAYLIGALLIRKSSYLKVGYLDETLHLGEFIDWFDRAKSSGLTFSILEEMVLKRRIHDRNQGIYNRSYVKDYLSVIKASLNRKRSADRPNRID